MKCDHGMKMDPIGECCPNNWCLLKAMIRREYAELSELSFFNRLRARLDGIESQTTRTWSNGTSTISQTFVTTYYKKKEYFRRWGCA